METSFRWAQIHIDRMVLQEFLNTTVVYSVAMQHNGKGWELLGKRRCYLGPNLGKAKAAAEMIVRMGGVCA